MARAVKIVLDESNPSKGWAASQVAKLGSALGIIPRFAQGATAADILVLPEGAKAAAILSVYARAGGATGYLAVAARDTTPAIGNAAINPDGDIEFAAADAITDAEVVYMPQEGEIFDEQVLVTAAGVGTLLQGRGAIQVLAAELLTAGGGTPGVKDVIARGTAAPGAGNASLSDDGLSVQFDAVEAGTGGTAQIRYIARPGTGNGVEDALGDRLDGTIDT